jgi:glycosidase
MHAEKRFSPLPILVVGLLLTGFALGAGASPVVKKVEPPNWWTTLPNPMLLISGEDFGGASVKASGGTGIRKVEVESTGHYIFVWPDFTKSKPGRITFSVTTPHGLAEIAFQLSARQTMAAGFQGFSRDDVIYLIMPDRFADGDASNDRPLHSDAVYDRSQPKAYHGGDIAGVRQHLNYLKDLGVDTIWLTPVWKNADSDYHGYHVVDFYAIDDHMGSLSDYEQLVAEAHHAGMKVLIDYVVNHTGPTHPWVGLPPSPEWFHGTPEKHLAPVYQFSALIDPHAPERDKLGPLDGWFVDRLPDLNTDDPEVAEYLLDNAIWWTESARLDGFRLDTFPYSSRRFWSQWLPRLQQVYPQVNSLGEVSDHDATVTSFFDGGKLQYDGIDSQVSTIFDYPLYYAMRDVLLRGEPVQKIIDVLQRDWLYAHPETLVTFIGNHDQSRFAGEAGSSKEKLELAFSLLLTLRGIPQLYYGDEIGMAGGNDPDNRRDFPGGFPGDARDAFTAKGRTAEEQEIFQHVQALLQLRKDHPALRDGRQWHLGWSDKYYAFLREKGRDKLLVVFNNAPTAQAVHLELGDTPAEEARGVEPVFGKAEATLNGHSLQITAPASSLTVLKLKLSSGADPASE